MSYDLRQEKHCPQNARQVYQAASQAAEKLEGKVLSSDPDKCSFEVKFDKTILGKVLGERTYLTCTVRAQGEESVATILAYPLDPVGRKLMFGARKGVTQTVVSWFIAHLEHNLKESGT